MALSYPSPVSSQVTPGSTNSETQIPTPSLATVTATPTAAPRLSLSEQLNGWYAFPIGVLGSAAYLVAVLAGMVGRGDDARGRILAYFNWWTALLYIASGGGVALVFQLPETKLVPVQAFIIGCTWPAVVANYLSGRQTGVPEAKQEEAKRVDQKEAQVQGVRSLQDALPQAEKAGEAKRKQALEELRAAAEQKGAE
jgi:hypothetical protein